MWPRGCQLLFQPPIASSTRLWVAPSGQDHTGSVRFRACISYLNVQRDRSALMNVLFAVALNQARSSVKQHDKLPPSMAAGEMLPTVTAIVLPPKPVDGPVRLTCSLSETLRNASQQTSRTEQ